MLLRSKLAGLVPYNPGKSLEELEKLTGQKIVRLSSNESLWGPSPLALDALKHNLDKINLYPDGAAQELKKALASLWGLDAACFCLGNGADEVIFMLAASLLDPGEEAVIPVPTFSQFEVAVTSAGGNCRFLPQPDLTFDLKDIAAGLTDKTRMVFLCNPNNPTGTSFTHRELQEFLQQVPQDIVVVLDEAYCHFAADPSFPRSAELLQKHRNLVVLRTFSKVYGLATLRIGYGAADPAIIRQMEKIRLPFNTGILQQTAALAALADESFIRQVVKETVRERCWLQEELRSLGYQTLPSHANFILFKPQTDAAQLAENLLQKGFLLRHTGSFGLPDWIRVTIGPQPLMTKLAETLQGLSASC